MKHRIAGRELELPGVVWIFDTDAATPTFHARRHALFSADAGLAGIVPTTRCGIAIHAEDRNGLRGAIHLPPKHAVRFARPCATCWPDLRNQPALFTRRRVLERPNRQEEL